MSEFSLELSEEQEQLRDWVHQFSVDVVRPAAEEWDEREEFPYPIVQQAAEIGLYSWDFLAQGMLGDKTGLTIPVAIEELFWGDAGIGMAIMGSALAAAGIAASGTQEQVMEWVPQCYGDAADLKLGAFCASEP
ncbi:MAG: acyl-CoA dehydrogenase family protein, partial [Acidimicrobiaceae bacterium]|nr:acyl-CoA dehydrogenase family protein [Acidimicrobiaceae bacterium]